jgi:hypothetical protein
MGLPQMPTSENERLPQAADWRRGENHLAIAAIATGINNMTVFSRNFYCDAPSFRRSS